MFIRLGFKSLPGTNTLAITKIIKLRRKRFYNIGPYKFGKMLAGLIDQCVLDKNAGKQQSKAAADV